MGDDEDLPERSQDLAAHGQRRARAVVAVAVVAVLAVAAAVGLLLRPGDTGTGTPPVAAPSVIAPPVVSPSPTALDRATLLATCPALAPSWMSERATPLPTGLAGAVLQRERNLLRHDEAYVRSLLADPEVMANGLTAAYGFPLTEADEHAMAVRQERAIEAAGVAQRHLDRLPADQAGGLRLAEAQTGVVLQVTRDAGAVRAALVAAVGTGVTVEVENVRYSKAELERIRTIVQESGVRWSSIGLGGDDRVEVMVPGDVAAARATIERLVDPCAVVVTHGEVTAAWGAGASPGSSG